MFFCQDQSEQVAGASRQDLSKNMARNEAEVSRVSEKIQMMKQSVAQLSVLSRAKSMDAVNKLCSQQEDHANYVVEAQKKLVLELNAIEQTLSEVEKARMAQAVRLANSFTSIQQSITNAADDARDDHKQNQNRFQDYRDQIMNLKIQLAQIQVTGKEKITKFNRESQLKLINCEKKIEKYEQQFKNSKIQKLLKSIKMVKNSIQQEQTKQQLDLKRMTGQLNDLKRLITQKITEEQRRQKDGFSQNYNALQELFNFLSDQYGVQN